jgi:hypothetical protein
VLPLHVAFVVTFVKVSALGWVIIADIVAVQPLLSVTVTV